MTHPRSSPAPMLSRRPEPVRWLRDTLSNGPHPVMELRADAMKAGIPVPALYDASRKVGVVVETVDGRKWWRLPGDAPRRRAVLLVDDEGLVRDLLGRVLQSAGLDVVVAADGREAIEVVEGRIGGVDMAVLDVHMPHLGGAGTLTALRERHPGIPCLFVTGDGNVADGSLLAAGDSAVLHKPFRPTEFLALVFALMDRIERPPTAPPRLG